MANRPFLMAHDSADPANGVSGTAKILAAANYQIPLLWLSLFDSEDVKAVEMPIEKADGSESTAPVPTLHAPIESARARYESRRALLLARLPVGLHTHVDEWERLLATVKHAFVQIDVAEIWMMFDPPEFDDAIRRHLPAFELGGAPWREVCAQAGLERYADSDDLTFDPAVVRFGLRGFQWEEPVPWAD
jgi:hypothetical protein